MNHDQWAMMEKWDAAMAYLKQILAEQRRTNQLLEELSEQRQSVGGTRGSVEPLPEMQPGGPASEGGPGEG